MNGRENVGVPCHDMEKIASCQFYIQVSKASEPFFFSTFLQAISFFKLGNFIVADEKLGGFLLFSFTRFALTISLPRHGALNRVFFILNNIITGMLAVFLIPAFTNSYILFLNTTTNEWWIKTSSRFVFPDQLLISLKYLWIILGISMFLYVISWIVSVNVNKRSQMKTVAKRA